jgi:hypothetical protein
MNLLFKRGTEDASAKDKRIGRYVAGRGAGQRRLDRHGFDRPQ